MKQNRSFLKLKLVTSTALVCAFTLFANLSLADDVAVSDTLSAHSGEVNFHWEKPMKVTSSQDDNAIILHFEREAAIKEPLDLIKRASGWIEDIRYGYDSIRIELASQVQADVSIDPTHVAIQLSPTGKKESVATNDQLLRVQMASAQLLIQQGQYSKALHEIEAMERDNPSVDDLKALKAQAYLQMGMWRHAIAAYDEAALLAPEDENYPLAAKQIRIDHMSYGDLGVEYVNIGNNREEWFTTLKGVQVLDKHLRLGGEINRDDADVDFVLDPKTGNIVGLNDSFHKGKLYLEYEYDNYNRARATLFAGESNIGVGASYVIHDSKGETGFEVRYHESYWGFIESVLDNGTRDRLAVSREHSFTPRFTMMTEAGLNNYNVEAQDDTLQTGSFDLSLVYTIPSSFAAVKFLGEDGAVSLRYNVDAEYNIDSDFLRDSGGNLYRPLPVASREVHSAVLNVSKNFTKDLFAEVFGGIAKDRLGSSGPTYGGNLFYDLTDYTTFRVGYLHGVGTEETKETLDSAYAGLQVRY